MFVCVFLICLYHCVYEALSENWDLPVLPGPSRTSFKSQTPVSVTATATLVLQVLLGCIIPANACHLAATGGHGAGS